MKDVDIFVQYTRRPTPYIVTPDECDEDIPPLNAVEHDVEAQQN